MNKTHKTIGAIVVGLVALFAYSYWETTTRGKVSRVFVDNNTASPVEVELTGGSTESCSLAPYSSCVVELDAGEEYTVVSQADGQEIQRSAFTLPELEWGSDSLYVVGPSRHYAVVTAGYGTSSSSAEALEATQPHTMLPQRPSLDTELNDTFPESVGGSGTGGSITHLCHYDPDTDQVGCPDA